MISSGASHGAGTSSATRKGTYTLPSCWGITAAAGTRYCSPLSNCTRTCVGSLCVGDAGGSTVPHQPSLPRTAAAFIDGMPTSHPERGGSRTPSGKKDYGQDDKGNEHHDPDDPPLHACGPLVCPGLLWPPVCHTDLLVHETIASFTLAARPAVSRLLDGPQQKTPYERVRASFIPRPRGRRAREQYPRRGPLPGPRAARLARGRLS